MIPDSIIKAVLIKAVREQFSKLQPAVRNFFSYASSLPDNDDTVTIHKWVSIEVRDNEPEKSVQALAVAAAKELVSATTAVATELIFRDIKLLPRHPLWSDGTPLFSITSSKSLKDRFGVRGGNIVQSTGSYDDDLVAAVNRMVELGYDLSRREHLNIFCAPAFSKTLRRSAAKLGITCSVFTLRGADDGQFPCRSWVLARDAPSCSLLIDKPSFQLPAIGDKVMVGARFSVWINDPRLAVYVMSY